MITVKIFNSIKKLKHCKHYKICDLTLGILEKCPI